MKTLPPVVGELVISIPYVGTVSLAHATLLTNICVAAPSPSVRLRHMRSICTGPGSIVARTLALMDRAMK